MSTVATRATDDRSPSVRSPHGPSRRSVLTGGLAAAAAGVAAGCAPGGRGSDDEPASRDAIARSESVGSARVPFTGDVQAGIVTTPPAHAEFRAFDLARGATRSEVEGVLRTWSQDAARLTSGRGGLADLEPELAALTARLTVTIGLGPGFFEAMRAPELRPSWLRPLPAFPRIDRLEDRWGGGDLLLQVCADDALTVAHASRTLASAVRGVAETRWRQRGFRRPAGADPEGRTQRNLFGQVDGTENPSEDDSDFASRLFSDGSDRRWMRGGSSLVLRRIRMDLDGWEKVDRPSRELAVGRRLDSGAPLTGSAERDPADFGAVDANGLPVIPTESHMARAHARDRSEVFLRRPYNYDDSAAGADDEIGLLFAAYQADPVRQFVPVQRRLAEQDVLNTWTTPIGSAVFALPPGARAGGFVGEGLF